MEALHVLSRINRSSERETYAETHAELEELREANKCTSKGQFCSTMKDLYQRKCRCMGILGISDSCNLSFCLLQVNFN